MTIKELKEKLEKDNAELGTQFNIKGAYGMWELWNDDMDRIDAGTADDMYEAWVKNRFKEKWRTKDVSKKASLDKKADTYPDSKNSFIRFYELDGQRQENPGPNYDRPFSFEPIEWDINNLANIIFDSIVNEVDDVIDEEPSYMHIGVIPFGTTTVYVYNYVWVDSKIGFNLESRHPIMEEDLEYVKKYHEKEASMEYIEQIEAGNDEETMNGDIAVALYWYCTNYHGGQNSDEYSILSNILYTPSPIGDFSHEVESVHMIYDEMVEGKVGLLEVVEWIGPSYFREGSYQSIIDNLMDVSEQKVVEKDYNPEHDDASITASLKVAMGPESKKFTELSNMYAPIETDANQMIYKDMAQMTMYKNEEEAEKDYAKINQWIETNKRMPTLTEMKDMFWYKIPSRTSKGDITMEKTADKKEDKVDIANIGKDDLSTESKMPDDKTMTKQVLDLYLLAKDVSGGGKRAERIEKSFEKIAKLRSIKETTWEYDRDGYEEMEHPAETTMDDKEHKDEEKEHKQDDKKAEVKKVEEMHDDKIEEEKRKEKIKYIQDMGRIGAFIDKKAEENTPVSEYEIVDLGIESPDYFRGFGTSNTRFDNSVVGIGSSSLEALEDAQDQIAQDGYDVSIIKRPYGFKDIPVENVEEGNEMYYHIGIRWN